MDVGVVGVVVVDRDPLEPGSEVVLHLAHEGPGMNAEIELRPLLGRDDGFPEAGGAPRPPRAGRGGGGEGAPPGGGSPAPPARARGARPRPTPPLAPPPAR